MPELFEAFEAVKPLLSTDVEPEAIRSLYSKIKSSNFSHEVLSTRANDLFVMPVKNVGWSNWGDPSRVLSTLARIGIQTEWAQTAG